MKLSRTETPATVKYFAASNQDMVVNEGIEIKLNHDVKLDAKVPEGKLWKAEVVVRIEEFDV